MHKNKQKIKERATCKNYTRQNEVKRANARKNKNIKNHRKMQIYFNIKNITVSSSKYIVDVYI